MISPYGRRQSVPSYGRAYDIDDFEIGGNRSPSAAAHRRQLSRNFLDERESSFEGIAGEENLGLQNVCILEGVESINCTGRVGEEGV